MYFIRDAHVSFTPLRTPNVVYTIFFLAMVNSFQRPAYFGYTD